MKIQKKFKPIFSISALWILFAAISLAQTTSRLSTTIIARGEKAYLEVAVIGSQADEPPEIPNIKNITVQPTSYSTQQRMIAGRKVEYIYEYLISSYDVGRYVIPSIEIIIDGVVNITEPIDFMIFNPDELDWSSLESGGRTIRYASAFRTLNKKPFENETIPVEIKAFVPEDLVVEDWGIPAFERDGLTAWRFQPTPRLNRINLLGTRYISVSYPSTITPTRTGAISIGPAKIRLTTRDVVMDPFPTQVNREVYLEVPKLNFECKPLPEGAPKGFENAVGSFKISASATDTKVQEGDPISVDLVVTGTGNLDTMKPPQLADSEGWKIYGTTADQRGEERRDLAGTMISHQSLRPLELKAEIPPFRLVYFDPKNETYQSVSTAPIPLQMTASNLTARPFDAAAPTLAVPIERMTDILGILRPSQISQGTAFTFPYWLGHVIPGLLALCLIAKALWMRYAPKFKKSISQETRLRELREIVRQLH